MNTELYIANVKREIEGEHKNWLDALVSKLPEDSNVFEVGSATARDAEYIESQKRSFRVVCSDNEKGFIEYLKSIGREVVDFDILKDSFGGKKYHAIFNHNLMIHFTLAEVERVILKMIEGTTEGGLIALSFAQGDNNSLVEWNSVEGNIFCRFHTKQEIEIIAQKLSLRFVYQGETTDKKTYFIILQK